MHEKTIASRTLYKGRILGLEVQDVELENGKKALREIVRHGGAVAVLARTPDGRYVFVRQFRKPVERDLLEVVAGNRDPGEDPAACARRELEEETGYRAASLVPLGYIYPSPGYGDERIDLFHAETEAVRGAAAPDDDENLDVILLASNEVCERIRSGEIVDSKTLAIWQKAGTIIGRDTSVEGGQA